MTFAATEAMGLEGWVAGLCKADATLPSRAHAHVADLDASQQRALKRRSVDDDVGNRSHK
jgi:hypothetical protein